MFFFHFGSLTNELNPCVAQILSTFKDHTNACPTWWSKPRHVERSGFTTRLLAIKSECYSKLVSFCRYFLLKGRLSFKYDKYSSSSAPICPLLVIGLPNCMPLSLALMSSRLYFYVFKKEHYFNCITSKYTPILFISPQMSVS